MPIAETSEEIPSSRAEGLNLASFQSLLGLSPPEIIGLWGTPNVLFPWENNGVNFIGAKFTQGQTAFFLNNQLWMVRLAPPYEASFSGLYLGIGKEEAAKAIKKEVQTSNDWVIPWDYAGFPVNIRLIFHEEQLKDFFLYRTDY